MNSFSERRPLNACWLALRLALCGGSLPVAVLLQAALCGLATYVAARLKAKFAK